MNSGDREPRAWRTVVDELRAGNERFRESRQEHPRLSTMWRTELVSGQNPKAAILGCSDSRVPPELIFDQGLGDLFVVRVAGNAIDDMVLASLEYAVAYLNVPLVVVMGHSHCGAVAAALEGGHREGRLRRLMEDLEPVVTGFRGRGADSVDTAMRIHVGKVAAEIRTSGELFSSRIADGSLAVVEATFDIETGRVDFEMQ